MEILDGRSSQGLQHSLSTIHAAKLQYHLLTADIPTTTALVSQIGLCDVLLREILAIRAGLEIERRRSDSKEFGHPASQSREYSDFVGT